MVNMTINPLKKIYDNESRISDLKAEIKSLESENAKCLQKVLLSGKHEQTVFRLVEKITTRRKPIPERVIAALGAEEALKVAKFEIKGLAGILGDDAITEVCQVDESVSYRVEKIK